jgi:hypothetical protein
VPSDPPDLAVIADPQRLAALQAAGLFDAPPVEDFDRVTRMAAELLGVPVVLVSLVDSERQFFLSRAGFGAPDVRETPLSHSFCQYVVATEEPLVIADARVIPWLRENGAIADLGIVAYAGYPLHPTTGSRSARSARSTASRASGPSASSTCCATSPRLCNPRSICARPTTRRATARRCWRGSRR